MNGNLSGTSDAPKRKGKLRVTCCGKKPGFLSSAFELPCPKKRLWLKSIAGPSLSCPPGPGKKEGRRKGVGGGGGGGGNPLAQYKRRRRQREEWHTKERILGGRGTSSWRRQPNNQPNPWRDRPPPPLPALLLQSRHLLVRGWQHGPATWTTRHLPPPS